MFQWGLASRALFARNWKVQGGWDGGAPILHTYPLALEPRPLKELVVEDAGEGIGLMILAVTTEVAGPRPERPALDVAFGPGERGAAANRWREGATAGWTAISGSLTQGAGVSSDGRATFRAVVPDGLYQGELELSASGWSAPFNVRAGGRLVTRGLVATSGCIPGVTSRADRIRFPVRVQGGHLELTLEADRTVGNWRHPVRLRGATWALTRLRLFPGTAEPPGPPAERVYGWEEREPEPSPVPDGAGSLKDARLQSCLRSRSPRGTFRADLPPGNYEVEMLFGARGDGRREAPVRMHVSLQGRRVLSDFEGGTYKEPVVRTFPARVAPGQPLRVTFERATAGSEWGINAIVVRPAR